MLAPQFRPEHVNHPKASVAASSAMAFNSDACITSYHKNVKEPDFNVSFFEKYDVVLNALDNVDARRHVNRLCLASDTPLIESGTTGYIGQIMPIVKGQMECYECRPKCNLHHLCSGVVVVVVVVVTSLRVIALPMCVCVAGPVASQPRQKYIPSAPSAQPQTSRCTALSGPRSSSS